FAGGGGAAGDAGTRLLPDRLAGRSLRRRLRPAADHARRRPHDLLAIADLGLHLGVPGRLRLRAGAVAAGSAVLETGDRMSSSEGGLIFTPARRLSREALRFAGR